MRVYKYPQSELDRVRWLLKWALGPLFDPEYDQDDDGIEAIIDWAAESGCSVEEAVTVEAKAVILVSTHLQGGSMAAH